MLSPELSAGEVDAIPVLEHRHLGTAPYDVAWALQREHRERVLGGQAGDLLLTVEHDPPVITAGRRSRSEHLRATEDELGQHGVQVRQSERGGSWTWHGKGQLVAYPIVALRGRKLRVPDFVAGLEAAMAAVVRQCFEAAGLRATDGLRVGRRCRYPGLWVEAPGMGCAKLGAVGVHMHRFVSLHGLALNLDPEPWGFHWILPCGLAEETTTSVARVARALGGDPASLPSVAEAADLLAGILPRCWASPESWACPQLEAPGEAGATR